MSGAGQVHAPHDQRRQTATAGKNFAVGKNFFTSTNDYDKISINRPSFPLPRSPPLPLTPYPLPLTPYPLPLTPYQTMKRVLLPLLATGFCLMSPLSQAASDYLLEIEGIKGESSDAKRPGTIEIESFSWGVSNAGSFAGGGGGGAGKVSMQDFHFVMKLGKATPKLMEACATGQHIKEAKLFVRKAGGDGPVEYFVLTFTDILVSSYRQSGASGTDSIPVDTLSLSVNAVQVDYTAADGSVHTGSAARTVDPAG